MQDSPNVLFIAIDDLFDFHAFRDSFGVTIQTPNLDALMADSTVFQNAFATTPVCNPSRTATLTGKSPFETNVHDNREIWHENNAIEETLPAVMKDAGYYTASGGKIFHGYGRQPDHVEDRIYSQDSPTIWDSFDRSLANPTGGGWNAQGYVGQDEHFYDHKVASHGVDFLETYDGDDPFMLMLGFKHPHNNFEMPQEYYDLYDVEDIQIPDAWVNGDLSDAPAFAAQFMAKGSFSPEDDFEEWRATVEAYLAAISHVDAQVGRVMEALNETGHADDTAVVLFSDHGFHLGDKDSFGKFTLWEESAKAPLMIKVPGVEGQVVDTPVSLIDIMPTVLDITGVDPAPFALGESLLPLVDPTQDGEHSGGPVFTQVYGSLSLRSDDMRYIRYADGSEELYDTSVDPGQTVNLAQNPAFAGTLEDLRDELWIEADRYGLTTNDDDAVLTGDAGNDVLMAQPDTETLEGGEGDDIYFLFNNDAEIIEDSDGGYDIAYLSGAGPIHLPEHVEEGFYGVLKAPNRVELHGNAEDNLLRITGAGVEARGGDGNDTIMAEQWSNNQLFGDAGDDAITGANWSDRIEGGTGNDTISAGRGTDFLEGGAGADHLIGGSGFDTADYTASSTGVHVSLASGRAYGDQAWGDRLSEIERLWGSDHNDVLMGDGATNELVGNAGNDYLNGQGGDDRLFGGFGADVLVGGAGTDFAMYQYSASGVSVNLNIGRAWQGEAEGDTFWGIEGIVGSNRVDTLIGNSTDNELIGRNGADYLHGGAGNDLLDGGRNGDGLVGGQGYDTVTYADSDEGIDVNLTEGTATGGHATNDWFWSVEHITGSDFADTITGYWGTGSIDGGQGSDELIFGLGGTTATGGTGQDSFVADGDYMQEGITHRVTDFEAVRDSLVLRNETTVQDVTAFGGNTLVTLQNAPDGEDFLSFILLEGVELSEDDITIEDEGDDLPIDE